MFYDKFIELCKKEGITPSKAVTDMGMNRSIATFWKAGTVPKMDTLSKMAQYFGVSVDFLVDAETEKAPALTEKDGRPVTDEDIKFALFGDAEIDDDVLDEVKRFAQFAKEQRRLKEQTGD